MCESLTSTQCIYYMHDLYLEYNISKRSFLSLAPLVLVNVMHATGAQENNTWDPWR